MRGALAVMGAALVVSFTGLLTCLLLVHNPHPLTSSPPHLLILSPPHILTPSSPHLLNSSAHHPPPPQVVGVKTEQRMLLLPWQIFHAGPTSKGLSSGQCLKVSHGHLLSKHHCSALIVRVYKCGLGSNPVKPKVKPAPGGSRRG